MHGRQLYSVRVLCYNAMESLQCGWLINPRKKLAYQALMADKSARSIRILWHGWPINQPVRFDYVAQMANKLAYGLPTFERQKLIFIYTRFLVHESRNWISWFFALKIMYIHLPWTICTADRGGASIFSPGNTSTKGKSLCQTVKMEKKNLCLAKGSPKISIAKGLKF